MKKTEQPDGSWWQTVPGLLTAVAGVLTACGGLLLALHQAGLLSATKNPVSVSAASSNDNSAIKSNEPVNAGPVSKANSPTANPHAARYTLAFPNGSDLKLRIYGGEGIFNVLTALVESRNTGKLTLKFSIRLTNKGSSGFNMGSGLFRLLVDGIPRAPTSSSTTWVAARSADEGEVIFEIPDTTRTLVLSLDNGEDAGNIPITLKKSG